MKILILANDDVGLYQFRRELIEVLLKNNEVIISLPDGERVNSLVDMGCSFIDTPIERRGVNPKTDLKLYFLYKKMMKCKNPDLVITYTIKPNIYGGYACRKLGIPYAENITGIGTAFQDNSRLRKLVSTMYRIGLRKAKVVFFENKENRQLFIDEKIVNEKQTCLLNGAGVNLDYFQVVEYPKENNTTRFLFVGRVMKEKGIEELLSAMKKLRAEGINCSLSVVGGYEEDYTDKIEEYEKEGWLYYYGYQKDVRPFIKNCHCFVLPSWHEGMANTNLECAASGRPIITTNIYGCKEAVIDGKSGYLVEKKNSKDLYEKMKKFCCLDYFTRKEMGLIGRKHIEDVFDKKQVVSETISKLLEN
ncbi:glycosyltransferase family 4 protein [Blautia glucerasea]